jgi:hypothetical protein
MTRQAVDRAWSIFEDGLNRDTDLVITRIRDMAAHGLVVAEKHLLGLHRQSDHTPHKYGKGAKAIGLQPDLERQESWRKMLGDKETSMYHTNKAIREEIEALEGGPEALRRLEKWYYNPGDPEQALLDPMAESEWEHEMDQLDDPQDWVAFEDWVYDRAAGMGWNYSDDDMMAITLAKIKAGSASPAEVEAMSAIYDYTQAHIQNRHISSFPVHRGLAMEPEDAAQLKKGSKIGTPITGHWSAKEDVSERFAANYYDRTPAHERPETKEVVIHKTFKPEEVFDYHLGAATKFDDFWRLEEKEVVPVDGTEHKITKVESRKSRYGGLETIHVWVK